MAMIKNVSKYDFQVAHINNDGTRIALGTFEIIESIRGTVRTRVGPKLFVDSFEEIIGSKVVGVGTRYDETLIGTLSFSRFSEAGSYRVFVDYEEYNIVVDNSLNATFQVKKFRPNADIEIYRID